MTCLTAPHLPYGPNSSQKRILRNKKKYLRAAPSRVMHRYPLSHALPKPPPCPISIVPVLVQVHVQVHAFLQVCLKTMPGERAGNIAGQVWNNCGIILGAFCSIWRARGTILGALGTCFETPFPRFGQMLDFRRVASRIPHPPGHPFFTLGRHFFLVWGVGG